jgi:uncharacterized protein YbjT (DUF2867 family)
MHILVFGPTGKTGLEIVRQALALGYQVTAFARRPGSLPFQSEGLHRVVGDITDAASVERAFANTTYDAVLSALGTKKLGRNTIISDGTRHILRALRTRTSTKRFVCLSASGVGDSRAEANSSFLYGRIIIPLILRNVYADKGRQEQLIAESGLDWTIVRATALTDGPPTGQYAVWCVGDADIPGLKGRISRADVAAFMLGEMVEGRYIRRAPSISA